MKIVIVDDDCLVTEALKTILQINEDVEVAATGIDGEDACRLYRQYCPDVLLMDIRMKGMNGLEASEHILQEYPEAKILLLTTFLDDEYIVKALRLGAKGYLLKQDYASILPALQAVNLGQTVFGKEIISKIPDLIRKEEKFDYSSYGINEREQEIIRLIADGYSNREIAAELFLSEGTIRNYLSAILDKLQLRDRTQVAVFYYQHRGIIIKKIYNYVEKGAREEAYTGKKACDEADRREKWEDERRYQALGKRKEKRQMYLIERHVRRRFLMNQYYVN